MQPPRLRQRRWPQEEEAAVAAPSPEAAMVASRTGGRRSSGEGFFILYFSSFYNFEKITNPHLHLSEVFIYPPINIFVSLNHLHVLHSFHIPLVILIS
jgi:hypothetical protein